MAAEPLFFSICDVVVAIEAPAGETRQALLANYAAMQVGAKPFHLRYQVDRRAQEYIAHRDDAVLTASGLGELVFNIEKDITLALQRLRTDLYFIHAGVVLSKRGAVLIIGASGAGKSTLTWGLVQSGYGYLSDELAPVEPQSLRVFPYPHALCLKREPPPPYTLPATTLRTDETLHIPVAAFAAQPAVASAIGAIVFVQYAPAHTAPAAREISAGSAAARLYTQALNPLAHTRMGLPAAADIVRRVPCYELDSAGLQETCALVQARVAPGIF